MAPDSPTEVVALAVNLDDVTPQVIAAAQAWMLQQEKSAS